MNYILVLVTLLLSQREYELYDVIPQCNTNTIKKKYNNHGYIFMLPTPKYFVISLNKINKNKHLSKL